MVPYIRIFKQALEITKQHKFLWVFGLFLSLSTLYSFEESTRAASNNLPEYLYLVLSIAIFILTIRLSTSLIIAIKAVIDKRETSAGKSYKFSGLFFSRVLLIYLMLFFGLFILAMVLGWPIAFLFQQHYVHRAQVLLALAIIIYLPMLIMALMLNILAPLFVVIFDLKIKEALQRSFDLFIKYLYPLVGVLVLFIIADFPALFLAYFVVKLQVGLAGSIAGGIVFILFQTGFVVFQEAVWILIFSDYVLPQKFEEAEPVVLPEIAS